MVRVGCLAALASGVGWNLRYTLADSLALRQQEPALREAVRALPANGAYAAQLADQVYASDPKLATALLQRATALDPYDAASWIQLGLLEEANNKNAAAESALLRAASADATFLPAWSLANFYFRRQNEPAFWYWAQRAAQMAPDDATGLLRLAWYVRPSVQDVENHLRFERPVIESQFVEFLIGQSDPPAVHEAAAHLLASGDAHSSPTILGACDWLLASKHPDLALALWDGLAERRRIAYPPLTPAMENPVTNGDFANQPTSLGFDWHMNPVAGVSTFLDTGPSALGFEFSAQEPDRFVLLSQDAPVEPGQAYALSLRSRSDGIASENGLAWTVTDARTGIPLAHVAAISAFAAGRTDACFAVPKDSHFIHLVLGYERPPGTVRPEGKLAVAQVRLENLRSRGCSAGH